MNFDYVLKTAGVMAYINSGFNLLLVLFSIPLLAKNAAGGILGITFFSILTYLYLIAARRLFHDLKKDWINYFLCFLFLVPVFLLLVGLIIGFSLAFLGN